MKWKLLAAALAGAAIALAAGGWALVRDGVSARSRLSPLEERVMYQVRLAVVANAATDQANPYGSADAWRAAAGAYLDECAVCHGPAGRGDAPLGSRMYPPAPDLTWSGTRGLSDGELYHVIAEGIRLTGMPAMAGHKSTDEIWQLVSLVRRLPDLDEATIRAAAGAPDRAGAAR